MGKKIKRTDLHSAQEIIDYFGGYIELGKKLGCTYNAILMWNGYIPAARAYELQYLSKGKFTVDRMPLRKPLHSAMTTESAAVE